jgi:CDP-6-deoxy-D-xylo-4-hexulose-3-dehydrase
VNTGFNLRPTEINAVLGLLQIRKLEHLNTRRNQIAAYWNQYFDPLIQSGILRLMKPNERSQVASFGYPVMFRDSHTRKIFRNFLDQHGIETRPIICGNMARQPALKHVKHRISGDLSGADQIMDCGLMWGLHPMMSAEEQEYVASMVLKCASQL